MPQAERNLRPYCSPAGYIALCLRGYEVEGLKKQPSSFHTSIEGFSLWKQTVSAQPRNILTAQANPLQNLRPECAKQMLIAPLPGVPGASPACSQQAQPPPGPVGTSRTWPSYESSLSSHSDAGKWDDEFISITTLPISHDLKGLFFLLEFPMTKISLFKAIIFSQSNARFHST